MPRHGVSALTIEGVDVLYTITRAHSTCTFLDTRTLDPVANYIYTHEHDVLLGVGDGDKHALLFFADEGVKALKVLPE